MVPIEVTQEFLSKKQLNKLVVYDMLMSQSNVLIADIQVKLDLSERTLKDLIQDFLIDIEELNLGPGCSIKSGNGILYVEKDIKDDDYLLIRNSLVLNYFSKSALYILFVYLLENRSSTIAKVSEELNYSISYSYKLTSILMTKLSNSYFNIEIKKRENKIELEGSEVEIRLAQYYFTTLVFSFIEWPMNSITKEHIKSIEAFINNGNYYMMTTTNQRKYDIVFAVQLNALKKGYKIDNQIAISRELNELFLSEKLYKKVKAFYKNNYLDNPQEIESETNFMNMVMMYTIPDLMDDTQKMTCGKMLSSSLSEDELIKGSIALVDEIISLGKFDASERYLLIYNITIRMFVLKYFNLWKFRIETKEEDSLVPELTETIAASMDRNFKPFVNEAFFKYAKDELTMILSYHILTYKSKSVKVYIELYLDVNLQLTIQKFLEYTYNSHCLEVVKNFNEADLIIGDILHGEHKEDKKFIFISDGNDPASWARLGQAIQAKIYERIIHAD